MAEHIQWLDDGTPYSPRFGDRYHSEDGGLAQAQQAFLHGCGLPAAWAGQPQWRILETGFGLGLNFLVTWAAWRADPQRCRMLHFVSLEAWPVAPADLLRAARQYPDLLPLAQELHDQFWGLLPGVHRLSFDNGQVLLTLCIGDAQTLLRQQDWTADSVYLDVFSPERNPDLWSLHTLKAVARCCRRGTHLATSTVAGAVRDALAQCGFEVHTVPGVAPQRDRLQVMFNPRWELRKPRAAMAPATPRRCIVIGGGLAGAATAASLARRGWQVQVLDTAAAPASGASGLPVGLFAPHLSPDDNVFSRVSRSGVRAMLQQCAALLHSGVDWCPSGVLERRSPDRLGVPADWDSGPGADWCGLASAAVLHAAGLPSGTSACWHARAGWLRPARLVAALLAHPGITWCPNACVAQLQRAAPDAEHTGDTWTVWQALDAPGHLLAEAELVVLAAGPACNALLAGLATPPLPLQSVRGQLSWGLQDTQATGLPPFPVNGSGALVSHVPFGGGHAWHMGSTFERDVEHLPLSHAEAAAAHASNWQHLQALLPGTAPTLQAAFDPAAPADAQRVQAWASVRCTAHDRLPIVGPIQATALPGLWVCTAMGARGLTRAVLCGELLAAQLHDEPLPLEAKLARAMSPARR
ncbi:FAD-dependent 5-carboxymethylaminomethyl-2-thiouridine(34) oxidoreductase MnmC [Simplicispira psychrophila]|uniref:FAD-dependent 5-carboxymethylaminomethyl-2-thiouridine(34) oxidoreductase MnmC n=1 Tax=Simplicispira psychrophila TaxID=80882 RepID=UPI00047F7552|nr:FAD-dependent 5-carboxymethylaminomethyl-2-thiouridine(34) oxidoreductase MnmC [Simplicispira psychrophila]